MALKKIRILAACDVEGAAYRVNQVVQLDAALAKPLVKDGLADDSKAAVDYCLNDLHAVVIDHVSPGFDADAEARAVAAAAEKEEAERKAAAEAEAAAKLEAERLAAEAAAQKQLQV